MQQQVMQANQFIVSFITSIMLAFDLFLFVTVMHQSMLIPRDSDTSKLTENLISLRISQFIVGFITSIMLKAFEFLHQ